MFLKNYNLILLPHFGNGYLIPYNFSKNWIILTPISNEYLKCSCGTFGLAQTLMGKLPLGPALGAIPLIHVKSETTNATKYVDIFGVVSNLVRLLFALKQLYYIIVKNKNVSI